ncbi:hypothetical protein [Bradyrhizobium sp. NP1]|uniref:hypothetical protein n=1 Tax=Bradyrhizobium sp. NP1 TaxID=3049772 RepID=UPI0025A530E6|nr:hypothetical protein [Bradyrhizobium sp. NP1]WJR82082.1 hypothetical protein QOU61_19695 [Bradyrhizobium sp. NP1]
MQGQRPAKVKCIFSLLGFFNQGIPFAAGWQAIGRFTGLVSEALQADFERVARVGAVPFLARFLHLNSIQLDLGKYRISTTPERALSWLEPRRSLSVDRARERAMKHSDHGILKNTNGEDQPADKARAQTAHHTGPDKSVSHEATGNPHLDDAGRTPTPGSAHRAPKQEPAPGPAVGSASSHEEKSNDDGRKGNRQSHR